MSKSIIGKLFAISIMAALLFGTIPGYTADEAETGSGEDGIAQWTFMVYMAAANNLEGAGVADVNEMEVAGSSADVNILVQMDRMEGEDTSNGDWVGTKRYYVTKDDLNNEIVSEEVEDLEEVNMGDPDTLIDFVKWGADNYPAEKYFLVLWNHGGAFWGIAWDDEEETPEGSIDRITMVEMKYAFDEIEDHLGRNIDIVGFDACLMAQMGVIYQLRDNVDYVVASGFVEPGDGWPYEAALPQLNDNPGMSPAEFGDIVAREYTSSYTDREDDPQDSPAITQAVFDMNKMNRAAEALSKFGMILGSKAGPVSQGGHFLQIQQARGDTNSYDLGAQIHPFNQGPLDPTGYCMYDVIDFAENIMYYIPRDNEIRDAAQELKDAANELMISSYVNQWHGNVKGANGLTMYFPSGAETTYDSHFDTLDLAQLHFWDEFLHTYHLRQNIERLPPIVSITSPADDEKANRDEMDAILVKGRAFDVNSMVSNVQIKVDDGEWVDVSGLTEWEGVIELSTLSNGRHTIYARALNMEGESPVQSTEFEIVVPEVATPSTGEAVLGAAPFIIGLVLLAGFGYVVWRRKISLIA